MKSISGKEWKERKIPKRLIDKYSSDFDISENLSKFYLTRFFKKEDILIKKVSGNNLNIFSISEPLLSFYLFWAGLMTLIPLFWYTKGFNLIGIGPASMIFFLTPTAQFFLGLYYFNEPLVLDELIAFIFIWIAVIIYLNELRKE